MEIREGYNRWAEQYDSNVNKTRDAEAVLLREMLADQAFSSCLEMGCGTGKNTVWLAGRTTQMIAVDFSEEMLVKAKEKIKEKHVRFVHADIKQHWSFTGESFDLVTFSLVLEHIEDLNAVFQKASLVLRPGGLLYVGELHPFKQYDGSKARFEAEDGVQVLTCFTHHVTDYTTEAVSAGLEIVKIREVFDEDGGARVMGFLFGK